MNVRPRRLLRAAGRPIAWFLRAIPRNRRFKAMRVIGRAVAPLVSLMPRYRRRGYSLDGVQEEALRLVVRAAAQARVEFEPDLEVHGGELLDACVAGSGSALVLTGHFGLSPFLARAIVDRGHALAAVRIQVQSPKMVSGTSIPLLDIPISRNVLVNVRNALRSGHVVLLHVDSSTPMEGAVPVRTPGGFLYVSRSIFAFAHRTRTPVLFGVTSDVGGQVKASFERPAAVDADTTLAAFCAFLQAHARERASRM